MGEPAAHCRPVVLLHSLIAHAADYYTGYDPAEEFMKQEARPESDHDGPDGGAAEKGGTDGDRSA
jgi:hypothetical protein